MRSTPSVGSRVDRGEAARALVGTATEILVGADHSSIEGFERENESQYQDACYVSDVTACGGLQASGNPLGGSCRPCLTAAAGSLPGTARY
jgi:hypothetical protein